MPESPSFLIRKKNKDQAEAMLVLLRGREEAKQELERIETEQEIHKEGTWKDLFCDKTNRKAALISYGLRTIQQFSGATALTFYCKTIFEESNDVINSNISTLLYFSLQLIVAFLMIFIVDSVGRKPLLLISVIGTTITLFLMSAYLFVKEKTDIDVTSFKFLPIFALFTNIVFFSIGIRNIPLLMTAEVFAPSIKSVALSFGTSYYSIVAFFVAKLYYVVNDAFGMYASFLLYGVLTLFSTFFIIFFIPETKGLNLEEIQKKLQGCEITNKV